MRDADQESAHSLDTAHGSGDGAFKGKAAFTPARHGNSIQTYQTVHRILTVTLTLSYSGAMAETAHTMTMEEIAAASGVPVRTIRFYITNRLLPGPGGRGRAAAYGEEHLLRLRVIRLLVEHHVPLEKIRQRLEGLAMADLQAVLAEEAARAEIERDVDAASPREYIAGLLRHARQGRFADAAEQYLPRAMPAPTQSVPPAAPAALPPSVTGPLPAPIPPPAATRARAVPVPAPQAPPASPAPPAVARPSGQDWRRWELAPGVELHVRDDAAQVYAGLIDQVLALTHAFKEGAYEDE